MKFATILATVAVLAAAVSAAPYRSSYQGANNIGNVGRVGGLGNNFFQGGIASDNSVKNKVRQGY
ncbi:hypothetical protein BDF14DRAFT_1877995 [Spinellus fusiger]|nr:hypothetical protein BDF14DRAFT_1877995 [Spinellus fusiger]